MHKPMLRWRKQLVALAVGGTALAAPLAGSPGGCTNIAAANILSGFGNGVIAAATDAIFSQTSQTVQDFVEAPVTEGLQSAWTDYTQFRFPIITVQRLFVVQ